MLQSLDKLSMNGGSVQTRARQVMTGLMARTSNAIGIVSYLRPGFFWIGSVLLLFVGPQNPEAAFILALSLVGIFAFDLFQAYLQWHEVFVHDLEGGVEIGLNEKRAAGFSDKILGGPRGVVMRPLPFWRWVAYKYTLRQDYVRSSTLRWLRHQLRSFCLNRGFQSARTWHPFYQSFWGDSAKQLAELVLETSLVLGISDIDNNDSRRRIATFCFDNWLCPAGTELPGETLKVERLKLRIDLARREAIDCELNGAHLGTGSDAMCYLYLALSSYHHTALHAYANWVANPDHADPHLKRAATWTLATNAVALFTGRTFQQNPETMKEALQYNCRRGIPKHGEGTLLRELAQHSRYIWFVHRARGALTRTVQDHDLDIDVESLFLSTVVHSLDHYMASLAVDPHDLVMTHSKHRAAQIVRLIFTEPLNPGFVNTRLSRVKSGWPRTLFVRLSAIDETLARQIDMGVAY